MPEHAKAQSPTQGAQQVYAVSEPGRATPARPPHALLEHQQAIGNQAVQRFLLATGVQAKLTVSQPGDPYEQEADRVADQVMRMPAAGSEAPRIQRKCAQCEDEEKLQPKEMPGQTAAVAPQARGRIEMLRGGGEPLAPSVRAWFEPRLGTDLGHVRVHAGAQAADAANSIHAKAYADGSNLVFGRGQYSPETPDGKRLLAHELVHTIQQGAPGTLRRTIGDGHDLKAPRFAGDPVLEACFDNERLLRVGANGPHVRKIQQALVDGGFPLPRFGVDGVFGSETQAAVKQFQESTGIKIDGIVGPETMGELDRKHTPGVPECPITRSDTIGAGGSAFALRGLGVPLNLRGLTCQLKGLTDAAALARIKSVSVTTKADDIVRDAGPTHVRVGTRVSATGSATLDPGPENANYEFGFVQVCRPFDVARATYLEMGATPDSNMLDFNATMNMRKGPPPLPALDHSTVFFAIPNAARTAMVEAKGTPDPAGKLAAINFEDPPGTPFQISVQKNNLFYSITGLAAEAFFFTAFVVKLPSGTFAPLRTFFWDFKYCEALPTNDVVNFLKKPKKAGKANVAPVRDCLTGTCDRSEPGFNRVGKTTPVSDTCLAISQGGFNATTFDGPAKFNIGCKS